MNKAKYKVLFVCIHNSARSQMAEAFLNQFGRNQFEAQSAGLEPGLLNPIVVEVMAEVGVDISHNPTNAVADFIQQAKQYQAVITVCDAASAQRCPVFPGNVKRIAWSFVDPNGFSGSKAEILHETRQVRDRIKEKVLDFILEAGNENFWL